MKFFDYDLDQLYGQAKAKAHAEAAFTYEEWKTVVDDLLQQHIEFGEVSEDNIELIRQQLWNRWSEFEQGISGK